MRKHLKKELIHLRETVNNKIEKRQKGEPVKKDSLYLVGEKGSELFSPSMSGIMDKLTTNHLTLQMIPMV